MADYYSLLLRSLENVADPRPETRRKVYERARSALVSQLRSLNPPLSESDILRECLALDEAVQAIEHLYQPPPDPEPTVYTPTRQDIYDHPGHFGVPPEQYQGYHYDQQGGQGFFPEASPHQDTRYQPQNYTDPSYLPQDRYHNPTFEALPHDMAQSSPQNDGQYDQNYGGYQAVHTNPNDSYGAPNEAGHTQQENFAAIIPPPEPSRDYRPRVVIQPPEEEKTNRKRRIILLSAIFSLIFVIAVLALSLKIRDSRLSQNASTNIVNQDGTITISSEGNGTALITTSNAHKMNERVNAAPASEVNDTEKENDIVEHRAFLIEELLMPPPDDKKRTPGHVVWKLETRKNSEDKTETIIHGTASFSEANLFMDIRIGKNMDETLPASNTILFQFSGAPSQTAKNVEKFLDFRVGISPDQVEKQVLQGASVKLDQNSYIFAVQKTDLNGLGMLKQLPWFRVLVTYESDQAAVLFFEKGPEGQRIFEEAFRAWGQ